MGFAGLPYLIVAAALGLGFLFFGLRVRNAPAMAAAARQLVLASVVYLPVILLALALDRI
jgi:heme O synthase-like polyprenyltransferase